MTANPSVYQAGCVRGRPLSTIELLAPDKTDAEAEDGRRTNEDLVGILTLCENAAGIENGAFELGSTLTVDNSQSRASYREFTLPGENKGFEIVGGREIIAEQGDDNHEHRQSGSVATEIQQSEDVQSQSTLSTENCNVKTSEDLRANIDMNTGATIKGHEALKSGRGSPVRSSWLLDGNVRRRDDTVWRRRKTDPSGELCANYSYHRDYQEALSSLLWEPYECRQPEMSPHQSAFGVGSAVDDADVSVWLYPPQSSPSSSPSSSVSSGSSSAVIGTVTIVGDGRLWSKAARDPSSSSLRALILSNSSSKDDELATPLPTGNNGFNRSEVRSEPVDGSSSCGSDKVGNVTDDPNQQEEVEESRRRRSSCEDAVGDLNTRWAVTAPPEALVSSSSAEDRCELCWQECSQCEARQARMLVSVEGSDASAIVSVSASGAVTTTSSSVSVVSCYRAVPAVVSAVPTISCLNVSHVNVEAGVSAARGRTFASTEAQTDDVVVEPVTPPSRANNNREQRRRERRERRHQRRANNTNPPQQHEPLWQTLVVEQPPVGSAGERLPDILNSHLPPPYSTLPLGLPPPSHVVHPHLHHPPPPPPPVPPPLPVPVPPPMAVPVTTAAPGSPHHHHHGGMRFPFQITAGGRRR